MLTLKMISSGADVYGEHWNLASASGHRKPFTQHRVNEVIGHLDRVLGTRGSKLCQLATPELLILWLEQLVFNCQLDKSRIIWEESLSEASSHLVGLWAHVYGTILNLLNLTYCGWHHSSGLGPGLRQWRK